MVSIKSRRGSYIMEAAIVLPFVILAVTTAVLIIMFFYSQMSLQCSMHMALRAEAGKVTEKTSLTHKISCDAEIYSKKRAFGGIAYAKKYMIMDHSLLLQSKGLLKIEDHAYAVDGTEYVRYCNLVKGAAGNEDDEEQ